MSRKKKSVQALPCPDYSHQLTKPLADLLHQKPAGRLSKFEAFRSLLMMAATNDASQGTDDVPTPLTVTVSQLAREWDWHRHTVSAFLDHLAELGVLSRDKTPDGFVIRFTSLTVSTVR